MRLKLKIGIIINKKTQIIEDHTFEILKLTYSNFLFDLRAYYII